MTEMNMLQAAEILSERLGGADMVFLNYFNSAESIGTLI